MSVIKLIIFFPLSWSLLSQTITNSNELNQFASNRSDEYLVDKQYALEFADENNIYPYFRFQDGTEMEIQSIDNGIPRYNITTNLGGARTVRTDKLWPSGSSGLNLTGIGYSKLGKWDGGKVRLTHQEFGGRVFQIDSPTSLSNHATHVAGSLISTGIDPNSKGMASEAFLDDYDWNNDEAEMATAASNGMEISNHSYVTACGWFYNTWFGDVNISTTEDYKFGYYSIYTFFWDNIAYNAPNYLIVKAAGNDWHNDCIPDVNGDCWVWINGVKVLNTETRDIDGGLDGYDCIPDKGVAKNILTVGAITELLEYTTPSDVNISSFSSWGPTDDGRIKPDIVAKGVDVYSTNSDSDTGYFTESGTSMASPAVTGSLALIQQYYQDSHSSGPLRSATLKALAIHTADEAGTGIGPDYTYGWGLLNTERAAELITQDSDGHDVIEEKLISLNEIHTSKITSNGSEPLKVTICWTDPPATPVTSDKLNNRQSMLINDLDLRVYCNGITYYPWKLDPDNPSNPASNITKNYIDNVEQVYIPYPQEGIYTIYVLHEGVLVNDSQAYSIIISGNCECTNGNIIYNTETGKFNFCEDGLWVEK